MSSSKDRPPLYGIVGQTASGKGSVARAIAKDLDAEIISLDSMKLFRGLDIGTGKPSVATRGTIPHHMIDVADPRQNYNIKAYVTHASKVREEIAGRGHIPLFCGGTSLYLKGLLMGLFDGPEADLTFRAKLTEEARERGPEVLHERLLSEDPVSAGKIHPKDLRRIIRALEVKAKTGRPISELQTQFAAKSSLFQPHLAGITWPRETLFSRIDARIDRMFEEGLVHEVEALERSGSLGRVAKKAVGYAEVLLALSGECSLEEARQLIKKNTRRFARQQMTWLRKFPDIHWFLVKNRGDFEALTGRVLDFLRSTEQARPE